MNKKDKKEKKNVISQVLDLNHARFKDDEVDTLFDFVTKPDKYDGKSKTISSSSSGFFSGGKFERKEDRTYSIKNNKDGIRIDEHYHCKDDDGYSDDWTYEHKRGRDILEILERIFQE